MSDLWSAVLLLVAVYCLVQTVRDLRARNYAIAAAGGLCLALLGLTPIQSHAVKLDVVAGEGPTEPGSGGR